MEQLGEIIKFLMEKHFITTVCSLVESAIVYAYTPDDFLLIERFTVVGYWLFVAGVFLFQFLIWIKKENSNKKEKKELHERKELYKHKRIQKELEELWDYVDSLCKRNINYLKFFLKNNNASIVIEGHPFFPYDSLLGSYRVKT